MAKKQTKYRVYGLRNEDYALPGERIPGEKKIIIGFINIDRTCFKKTPEERRKLKMAKLSAN